MSASAGSDDQQAPQPAGGRRGPNLAASVRSRLTALAHARGEETEYLLTRYALERLLYRLARSPHASLFILKGALLFALWEDHPHRATRDIDLLGFGSPEVGRVEQIFRDLCTLAVEADGLIFLPESVHARRIREQQEYGGIRVVLLATLGTSHPAGPHPPALGHHPAPREELDRLAADLRAALHRAPGDGRA